jgi:DNA-binding SARP family transcriptional activator/tetratricopeptide (TPR) repeat protein
MLRSAWSRQEERGLEFRILGPMEVLDGDRHVGLPAGRARALLALLVLHTGESVTAERLIDELWGEDPPPTASTAVQGHVSRLRRLLEPARSGGQPGIIETVGLGYRLAAAPSAVDANRFKNLLDQARLATGELRSVTLARALGLWRGPALADFTYEPFAQRAITALEGLRLAATEDRIDADLALGWHGKLVPEIEGLVVEHPFRERFRGQLMLALYRSGRQADALGAFRAAREALVEELGIEPGPPLRQLQQAILNHDRSLDAPIPTSRPEPSELPSAEHWLPRERRVVTVLYADLASPEETDPEAQRTDVTHSLELAAGVLHRHGARVEEVIGDLLVAFFGLPVAHEEDAVRAVRAAVELRAAVPTPCRIGVETGELLIGTGRSLTARASGPALALAARLQHSAAHGDILVGPSTRRLVRGAAVLKAAGADDAWRVLQVMTDAPPIDRRLDPPMVGRAADLTRLRTAFASAARTKSPDRLTVLGDAGIGKSRLSRAFAESVESGASIITGRCPAYGQGVTFLPLREAVLDAAGPGGWPTLVELLSGEEDGERTADQIAAAIGLTPQPGRPDQLFPAVRRLFEVLARERPVVAIFEDVHWAEATFLDLIDHIHERGRGPIFLLCLARPELVEARPGWSHGSLTLEPLEAPDVEQLIADRADTTPPPETLGRIIEAAQGNPLFAEQLLAAFEQGGVESIPASLQSLLAMRLDRLGPGERDLLRTASVIGSDVSEEALRVLVPDPARPFVPRHLQALESRRLIERDNDRVQFRHVLIRQAAYQSMTRSDRAELHERFADWLEAGAPETPPDLDEIAGYHLQQAAEQRRAIGLDAATLALRAGDRLANAGERAVRRADLPAAERFLSSARALLPTDHPRRAIVTQRLAETGLPLGHHRQSQQLLGEMIEDARTKGDRSSELYARLERARVQLLVGPDPVPLEALRREADEAWAFFTETEDEGGMAQAAFLSAFAEERAGNIAAMEQRYRTSLVHADRSGQMREMLGARWMVAHALVLGTVAVPEAIDQCGALLSIQEFEVPGVRLALGLLVGMAGRFDEAREMHERASRMIEEQMRVRRLSKFVALSRATVEVMAGDLPAAERELRAALEIDRAIGKERDDLSQTAARLALVLSRQGRDEEAGEMAALAAEAAPAESAAAQALCRAARARATASTELARKAVALSPEGMPNLRADLLVELASVLRGHRDEAGAGAALARAAGLYQRKGNDAAVALIGR